MVNQHSSSVATTKRSLSKPICEYRGPPTGESARCDSCGATEKTTPVFSCSVYGVCAATASSLPTTDPLVRRKIQPCRRCPDYVGGWPRRFDENNLWEGVPGKRFNPSLLPYESGYLLAARNGWAGSEIYLGKLDREFRPVGSPIRLDLYRQGEANYGREDPRLFYHDGRVHIAYAGVVGGHSIRHTNVCYARLSTDLSVEETFAPHYVPRNKWEKNWSFFSQEDVLYAVYGISPHVVLRIDGGSATKAYETENALPWAGGERRGGASPVLVGDEYWGFFHDRIKGPDGKYVYRTGVYTFDASPPFAPRRHVPAPIMTADLHDKPADQYAHVVFTCGAVLAGGEWVLSSGRHDRWMTLDKFSHSELEKKMVTS